RHRRPLCDAGRRHSVKSRSTAIVIRTRALAAYEAPATRSVARVGCKRLGFKVAREGRRREMVATGGRLPAVLGAEDHHEPEDRGALRPDPLHIQADGAIFKKAQRRSFLSCLRISNEKSLGLYYWSLCGCLSE